MPIAPNALFEQVGLACAGSSRWGTRPNTASVGVYAISLSPDPKACASLPAPNFSAVQIAKWIAHVPAMRLRGQPPTPVAIADHLRTFWHPEETIVYIGKATSLSSRVPQFFGHTLGNSSPHKGGHWLKALVNLQDLHIHWACCDNESQARAYEDAALTAFRNQVLAYRTDLHATPVIAIPFANRTHEGRKQSALSPETL
ncbi:MAG: hypothetical protein JSR77_13155 [Planctomycetes bacterium]|nr:hypothetical protein [Planctomycetota bacterium]